MDWEKPSCHNLRLRDKSVDIMFREDHMVFKSESLREHTISYSIIFCDPLKRTAYKRFEGGCECESKCANASVLLSVWTTN